MRVTIEDDFELDKIANCGQCFRAKRMDNGAYRFITGKKILYIKKMNENVYDVSCENYDWINVWFHYFDLETDYRKIREEISLANDYFKEASEMGKGIRILKQDPFEMLISFIISQRKTIPAIQTAIEKICERYGTEIETIYEKVYTFPSIEDLKQVSILELSNCTLGYRAEYVRDAIEKLHEGIIDLEELKQNKNDDEMVEELKRIKGVGDKVANCVALFGYHRVDRVPIDVWIERVIIEDWARHNLFAKLLHYGGIAQQYIFYTKRFNNEISN